MLKLLSDLVSWGRNALNITLSLPLLVYIDPPPAEVVAPPSIKHSTERLQLKKEVI